MAYDSKCEELGRLFLGDVDGALTDENARELAQQIQDTIEAFIEALEGAAFAGRRIGGG